MKIDKFGAVWDLSPDELCFVCGQPDNCGDCDHKPMSDDQIKELGGIRFTHVVVAGNLVDGFQAYGAFTSERSADSWIERVERHSYSADDMTTMKIERAT